MKRFFDLIISFFGLILFLPLIIFLSFLIKLSSPGPVFYRGTRIGQYGKSFKIWKFRTMIHNSESKGAYNVSLKDTRLTKAGSFLRKTKLDEIPQLINVLIGNMSFVGPRPDIKKYTDLYISDEKLILNLKPGITDWASLVNINQYLKFNNSDNPDKVFIEKIRPIKVKLQLYYLKYHSFSDDIQILFLTLLKLIFGISYLPPKINSIIRE